MIFATDIEPIHTSNVIFYIQIEAEIGNNKPISETLKWIAYGPNHYVCKYDGYVINECRYHTKELDDLRSTQNSGVSIVASTMQIASVKDKNPVFGELLSMGLLLRYETLIIPCLRYQFSSVIGSTIRMI